MHSRTLLGLTLALAMSAPTGACDDEGRSTPGAVDGGADAEGADGGRDGGDGDTNTDTNADADVCADGTPICVSPTEAGVCNGGQTVVTETCHGQVCSSGRCVNEETCQPGSVDGCWDHAAQRMCAESGTVYEAHPCAAGLACLAGECTEAICVPQTQHCRDEDTLEVCSDDGTEYIEQEPCPEGSVCLEGRCLSGCDLSEKHPSYIGCKYWSLDLDNYPDPFGDPAAIPHAVVISNPSDEEATVNITTMSPITLDPHVLVVAAHDVGVFTFPRLDVDGSGITPNSFFLESSWPVVAYQFNPLNNEGVASNDASLLLPSEFLGSEYIGMAWPSSPMADELGLPPQHGYLTVVATRPGLTNVTVRPTVDVEGGQHVPFLTAGETYQFALNQFEVLNLEADASNMFDTNTDLTGTPITADQPIAVFGGHEEAVVGGECCAEHLEQQLFAVNTWGDHYFAVPVENRGGSVDLWRVLAAYDDTLVTTMPPQPGADSITLDRGQYLDISTSASFEIVASAPISVGQYLASSGATADGIGDPSFILAVPLNQLRSSYTVLTPTDYDENWLTIVRLRDDPVTLDGAAIRDSLFHTFGIGGYEWAWVTVDEGAHTVEAPNTFALVAYGYSNAVSYGYPGGMDLRR